MIDHIAKVLLRPGADLRHASPVQLAGAFEQRGHGIFEHHGALLQCVELLDADARRALGENLPLDGFKLHLDRVDHREIAVDYGVHQRIQHEACAVAQQLGFSFAALAHAQKTLLAPIAHRQHVVATDEDIDFADVDPDGAVRCRLQQVKNDEQRVPVFLDLGALVAVPGVFDRQFVQAELFLHFVQFFRRGIDQRHPDEASGTGDVVADIGDRNIGQLGAVFIGNAIDQHEISCAVNGNEVIRS